MFFRLGMVALSKFMGFRVLSSIELTETALGISSDNDKDFDQFVAAASTVAKLRRPPRHERRHTMGFLLQL